MLEDEEDRKRYATLEPPKSMVCRYGYMKLIAELPYDGQDKPGCGSKLVIRTQRGIELAEMLTTTCANAGCGKSVTRKQMLRYIDASGGKDFPFTNQGRVLRVATMDDLRDQQRLDVQKAEILKFARTLIAELGLQMKLVDVERLLGGERMIFHYTSEHWVDFRELVRQLASEYQTRIEMHQVNARDEARLTADYEKCGQHCCCKQFLKVLKPVSMRSAKVQKATLDPTKISGRCGRLMCCLRYEDQTYESLRKRLPHRQSRVLTEEGPGTVLDTQILTQLALVIVDGCAAPSAYPVENIKPLSKEEDLKLREKPTTQDRPPPPGGGNRPTTRRKEPKATAVTPKTTPPPPSSSDTGVAPPSDTDSPTSAAASSEEPTRKRRPRRRRRRKRRGGDTGPTDSTAGHED